MRVSNMNYKSRFADLPINEPFLYNGIVYTKSSETQGLSQRLGLFTIYPDEVVEVAVSSTKDDIPLLNPVMRFLLGWTIVMGTLYLIGEYCI